MRYYRGDIDVYRIVQAGLAVRALARTQPGIGDFDFSLQLGESYAGWMAEFIDTVLDLVEERHRTAARLWALRKKHRARCVCAPRVGQ